MREIEDRHRRTTLVVSRPSHSTIEDPRQIEVRGRAGIFVRDEFTVRRGETASVARGHYAPDERLYPLSSILYLLFSSRRGATQPAMSPCDQAPSISLQSAPVGFLF